MCKHDWWSSDHRSVGQWSPCLMVRFCNLERSHRQMMEVSRSTAFENKIDKHSDTATLGIVPGWAKFSNLPSGIRCPWNPHLKEKCVSVCQSITFDNRLLIDRGWLECSGGLFASMFLKRKCMETLLSRKKNACTVHQDAKNRKRQGFLQTGSAAKQNFANFIKLCFLIFLGVGTLRLCSFLAAKELKWNTVNDHQLPSSSSALLEGPAKKSPARRARRSGTPPWDPCWKGTPAKKWSHAMIKLKRCKVE